MLSVLLFFILFLTKLIAEGNKKGISLVLIDANEPSILNVHTDAVVMEFSEVNAWM